MHGILKMIRPAAILIVKITAVIILPLTAAVFILYHIYPRSMAIYPNPDFGISSYSDILYGGTSTIKYTDTGPLLYAEYYLEKKVKNPFAGIAFSRRNTCYWGVSKFNCLALRLKTTGNDHLGVIMDSFLDGFSQPGNYATYLHSEVEIQNNGDFTDYTVPFKFFSVPKWWYSQNNLIFTGNKKVNLKKIGTVELANCAFCDVAVKHQIQVQSIRLVNIYGIPYFVAFAAGVAGYALLVFLYFSKKLPVRKPFRADLHYTKLELSNRGDQEYGKVAAFLAEAFHEPDLTIDKVAKATGVSIYKIPVLIKNQTNRSFKEYLNTIRLTEAQRLLSETDRQIIEISFAVGYNNISHFNRIFKEKNGKTPREFRVQSIS